MLVCMGGLHGNEPAGVFALRRVFQALVDRAHDMHGSFVALSGNGRSLARNERYIDADLNRIWTRERVTELRESREPRGSEEEELLDIDGVLAKIVPTARGPVSFIDLHSTSGGGPSFSLLDDTLANRRLAFSLPVTHVLGLEEELSGTFLGFLNDQGYAATGYECGQHSDPASIDRAEAAVWVLLEGAGVLPPGAFAEVAAARAYLTAESASLPDVVEVRYRHHISPGDAFVMRPGFANFQAVSQGEGLADSALGEISAWLPGMILMPLYQSKGEDGFFIVRSVHLFWLWLSMIMRRLRAERFMHRLPGVCKDPEHPGQLLVDTGRARWLALQLFHLLGFRRRRGRNRTLRMSRRVDTPSSGGGYAA